MKDCADTDAKVSNRSKRVSIADQLGRFSSSDRSFQHLRLEQQHPMTPSTETATITRRSKNHKGSKQTLRSIR